MTSTDKIKSLKALTDRKGTALTVRIETAQRMARELECECAEDTSARTIYTVERDGLTVTIVMLHHEDYARVVVAGEVAQEDAEVKTERVVVGEVVSGPAKGARCTVRYEGGDTVTVAIFKPGKLLVQRAKRADLVGVVEITRTARKAERDELQQAAGSNNGKIKMSTWEREQIRRKARWEGRREVRLAAGRSYRSC